MNPLVGARCCPRKVVIWSESQRVQRTFLTKTSLIIKFSFGHHNMIDQRYLPKNLKNPYSKVEVFHVVHPNAGIIMNSVYQVNPIINTVKYAPNKYIYIRSESFK